MDLREDQRLIEAFFYRRHLVVDKSKSKLADIFAESILNREASEYWQNCYCQIYSETRKPMNFKFIFIKFQLLRFPDYLDQVFH